MRIDIASDLHIHSRNAISPMFFRNPGDVLILAGDIAPFSYYQNLLPFFQQVSEIWKTILFVPGNHEYYGGRYIDVRQSLKTFFLNNYPNMMVLDNDVEEIEDVWFIGATLWADMDKGNEMTKLICRTEVADYVYIFHEPGVKISPDDSIKWHQNDVTFLKESLVASKDQRVVVITHHAPSFQSIAQKHKESKTNGAFASNLEYIIDDNPHIVMWIHGHVHTPFDYQIGNTQVICNPRGYPGENPGLYRPIQVSI